MLGLPIKQNLCHFSVKFGFRDDPALVDTALVNAASVKNDVYLWIYTIHTIKQHIVMI